MPTRAINDTGVKYVYDKLDTKKADKVTSATNGNLAGLNGSGNITDSGWASDKTTTLASGNPISITGLKSNQLAVNPVITFEPIQAGSGDPSPSNVRAISGYDKIEVLSCGKNIFDKDKVTYGELDQNTGEEIPGPNVYRSGWMRVKPNTKYVVSGISVIRPFYYAHGKIFIEMASSTTGSTFTTPNGCAYLRFQTTGPTWQASVNPQIEEGETATTYEPYHKTTDLSENLPQTVYGGTLDVRTGVLTVDKGYVDLGSLTYSKDTSYSQNVFYAYSTSIPIPKNDSASAVANIISEIYKADSANNIDRATTNYTVGVMQYSTGARVWICDSRYTSATDLQNALSGVKAVYELKTPIEIQLTPHEISLLKDYAYVSTNGTSIALDYHNGEIATLGDVSQLGETVNLIGEKVEFEDVSQYFVKDDTNINSANISAYRIGKMVFISGSFVPNALSSMQNKLLFNITNDKILPLSANIPISGIYVPIISQSSTAWSIILSINKLNKRIKTDNNGAYGQISNITTNSLITFSASYICQG